MEIAKSKYTYKAASLLAFCHTDFEIGLPKYERVENAGGSGYTGLNRVLSVIEVKKINPRGRCGD